MEKFVRFCKTLGATEGLETIEYAIISGVIVVAMIVTWDLVGGNLAERFRNLLTAIGG